MTRRLVIEWAPGRKVEALLSVADGADRACLLAHGAGAGQRHAFMEGMRRRLAAAGVTTMTFDYPYVAEGRRAPDRPATLLACHRAALARLASYDDRIVLAGKSMGGRMASHVAAESETSSPLVVFGYPLVALGAEAPRDTSHLDLVSGPKLFVTGARDAMAPRGLIETVVDRVGGRLVVVEDADHGFRVPKRVMAPEDVIGSLVSVTTEWLQTLGAPR